MKKALILLAFLTSLVISASSQSIPPTKWIEADGSLMLNPPRTVIVPNGSISGTTVTLTGGGGTVSSVFGRTGAVVAAQDDYTFAQLASKPTTLTGYGITDAQPLDSDLTAIAALTTTSFGRGLLTETNAASLKTTLSLNNVENTALSTWAGSTNITTLGTISAGTWNGSVIGSAYGGAGTVSGLLKANGSGTVSAAVSATDYAPATSGSAILKGNGAGGFSAASGGTDYEVPVTYSTGLTRSVNTVTVNTSQNIATLSNLTSNGLVTTSGGAGTLGVTVPGTGVLTALGVNVGSAGAFVTFNGAGGTPSSITLTNGSGLPLSTGVTGTLPIANGGTALTAVPGSAGQLLFNSAGAYGATAALVYSATADQTLKAIPSSSKTGLLIYEPGSTPPATIQAAPVLQHLHVTDEIAYWALGYSSNSTTAEWANYLSDQGELIFNSSDNGGGSFGQLEVRFAPTTDGGQHFFYPKGFEFISASTTYYGGIGEVSSDVFGLMATTNTPTSGALFPLRWSNSYVDHPPFGASAGNTTEHRYLELAANGSNYIGFKAPDAITANKIWTLPSADGTSGQVLQTNGSGTLSWGAGGGGLNPTGSSTTNGDITLVGQAVAGGDVLLDLTPAANTAVAAEQPDFIVRAHTTTTNATTTNFRFNQFLAPTLASDSSRTTTRAATLYVNAAPTAGTNMTITTPLAFWVGGGNTQLDGFLGVGTNAPATTQFYVQAQSSGNVTAQLDSAVGASADILRIRRNTSNVFVLEGTAGMLSHTPLATTSATPRHQVNTAADVTLGTSTETPYVRFGGDSSGATVSRQWNTGALTTQRENIFVAPTYAAVGASTFTNTATVAITGAPVSGTNVTQTTPAAFWVQGGLSRFDGAITQTSASATAFESGPNGSTNPVFRLVNSTASAATGLSITGRAAAAGVDLTVITSAATESLNVVTVGTGSKINHVNTGNVTTQISRTEFKVASNNIVGWTSGFTDATAALDTGFERKAAAHVRINNGSTGAGSLVLGTSTVGSVGTSGVGVLAIANGTAPTTSPAGEFQLYSADWNGAGTAAAFLRNEEGTIYKFGSTFQSPATTIADTLFASLPAATNGTILYCSDCAPTTPFVNSTCVGSGTGSLAIRLNGAWKCTN